MSSNSVRWAFNFSKWSPSQSEMLLAMTCVQAEEKARLAKFVFKNDVKSSLIGLLMMRKFVNIATQQPYNEIKFVRDSKGKPELVNKPSFPKVVCNVSHQGNFTVLAGVSDGVQLGVDVMKVEVHPQKNIKEYFRLMSRVFSGSEWETIRNAGCEENQLAMFCRHWCLKESYLKAVGVGITVNLKDICFKIHTSTLKKDSIVNDTEAYFRGEKLDWEFQEMLLDSEHCVAVAFSSRNNDKILFEEVSLESLLNNTTPLLDRDEEYCNTFFSKSDKV